MRGGTAPMKLEDIDLTDLDLFANGDPHQAFTVLREQAPVYWHERKSRGFWAITRYQDVLDIYHDPQTFSSERGISLSFPEDMVATDEQAGFGQMMITTDPPRHARVRQIVNRRFTPRAVMPYEPQVRRITTDIIDSIIENGECDFVVDVAAKLPTAVICEMMGIPREHWEMMFHLGNMSIGMQDPEYQDGRSAAETGAQAAAQVFSYFSKLVDQRRKNPGDDLISAFTHGEAEGSRLTDLEILFNCFLTIIGGQETTRNATSGGVLALIQNPAEAAKLRSDPSLYPKAIEEFLRWTSPVSHIMRTAKRDTEFRDNKIHARQRVVLWNVSANRDERVFDEPHKFKVDRTPNDHLAFGHGEHFCLGANLARLELRVMIEEVARRLSDLEVTGPVQRLRSNFVAGIKHMPVRFRPTRREMRAEAVVA
jgi:cytochrome P450